MSWSSRSAVTGGRASGSSVGACITEGPGRLFSPCRRTCTAASRVSSSLPGRTPCCTLRLLGSSRTLLSTFATCRASSFATYASSGLSKIRLQPSARVAVIYSGIVSAASSVALLLTSTTSLGLVEIWLLCIIVEGKIRSIALI